MKTLCKLIVGALIVVWLAGCGEEPQKAADAGTQPGGAAAPASQVQQTMAIGQTVDQAASGGASRKAAVNAANSIDKINAQKKAEQ